MKNAELYNEKHEATYCPEDNKLRLYVGRVPRPEYDALRAEGWTSTAKQSCDFVATWSPRREDTALSYAGEIGDEDQSPTDRAADRAERFGGYLDKRREEAGAHADTYDAGPSVHGYQNAERAERAAARHDRHADRACSAWSKAEYWQQRTAGVISNALYKSGPGVRMGRIKVLEAEIRNLSEGRYKEHCILRLAYENQMLEAQGGRLASVDMIPGGWINGEQIQKVNKSPKTGRVVSVLVKVPRVEGWCYRVQNVPGTDYALKQIETERMRPEAYTAPTAEEVEAFEAERKTDKAERKAKTPKGPSLINPTKAEAERLQAVWNEQNKSYYSYYNTAPAEVKEMTQAEYSARSGGAYAQCETVWFTGGGRLPSRSYQAVNFPPVAKVRKWSNSVIVITDKPQKAFPAEAWNDPRPATEAEVLANWETLASACRNSWRDKMTAEEADIFRKARLVGLAHSDSLTQFGLTDKGHAIAAERSAQAVTA